MSEETEKKDGVVSEVADYRNSPDPRLSIRAYLLGIQLGEQVEVESVAEQFKVAPIMVREVISTMLVEGAHTSPPMPYIAPAEVTFEPVAPKVDPVANESIDATLQRLKKVDDAPVKKWVRSHEKSTKEKLGLVDPRNPRDPSEYEWHQIDWNLEACYAGWGVMGIRLIGKRQTCLFMNIDAIKRGLEICGDITDIGDVKHG